MKRFSFSLLLIGSLYLMGPFLAGILGYVLVTGPRIYPAQLHASIYAVGATLTGGSSKVASGLRRPLFYGGTIYIKRSYYEKLSPAQRLAVDGSFPIEPE